MAQNKSFGDKMEQVLMPVANFLGNQRHLAAVRDSFITTFPIVFSGSILLLINVLLGLINQSIGGGLTGLSTFIGELSGPAINATNGLLALFIAFLIGYNYAVIGKQNGPVSGIISVAGFFIFYVPAFTAEHPEFGEQAVILQGHLGATGLFTAMLVGLLSSTIYCKLAKVDALKIKMPAQVPPAVANSFSALIPSTLVMLIMVLANWFIVKYVNEFGLLIVIQEIIAAPLMKLGESPVTLLVLVFMSSLLWVFGIHGPNTLAAVISTIYTQLGLQNTEFLNNLPADFVGNPAWEVPNKITWSIVDVYTNIGGSGATLGLLIAIFLFSKREDYKTVAKLSVVPGLFNINEPVVFGMPIVLNPILAIPFIITPVLVTGITMVAINIGIIPPPALTSVWMLPGPINAFISSLDWKAPVFSILMIMLSTAIYTPFVLFLNKQIEVEEEE